MGVLAWTFGLGMMWRELLLEPLISPRLRRAWRRLWPVLALAWYWLVIVVSLGVIFVILFLAAKVQGG